jgi:hypothetical protein
MQKEKMYYIYELWNPIDNEPIYVGYGKHNRKTTQPRYKDHIREAIKYKNNQIKNIKKLNMYKIHVILQLVEKEIDIEYRFPYENLTYNEACEKERKLIEFYGRRCIKTGRLTNIDAGGRGGRILTEETKIKMSEAHKGKPSHLKGQKLGSYSKERCEAISKGIKIFNDSEKGKEIRKNSNEKKKGKTAWNKDKTKETCEKVAKYAESKKGKPRPDMIGKTPWNAGKTKETDLRLAKMSNTMKGKSSWNKGLTLNTKGKSYEEIYGVEKSIQMKESRRNTAWINNGQENKKIKIDELQDWNNKGWVRGRLMPKRK